MLFLIKRQTSSLHIYIDKQGLTFNTRVPEGNFHIFLPRPAQFETVPAVSVSGIGRQVQVDFV